jgi:hypothetical protein
MAVSWRLASSALRFTWLPGRRGASFLAARGMRPRGLIQLVSSRSLCSCRLLQCFSIDWALSLIHKSHFRENSTEGRCQARRFTRGARLVDEKAFPSNWMARWFGYWVSSVFGSERNQALMILPSRTS